MGPPPPLSQPPLTSAFFPSRPHPPDLRFIEVSEEDGGGARGLEVRPKTPSSPTPSTSTTSDLSEDPATEEALKGFDFLSSPDEDASAAWRSGEDGGEWGETRTPPPHCCLATDQRQSGQLW